MRCAIIAMLLASPVLADAPIAWREEFESSESLERASVYYEDRGSGKTGDDVVISEVRDGVYTKGIKHDPARRQDRLNLTYGDVCWGRPRTGDLHRLPDDPKKFGPFDTSKHPLVEIRWRGDEFTLYWGVETQAGTRRGGYSHIPVARTETDAQGNEWNVGVFRAAADSSVPGPTTAVKLLGIDLAHMSPENVGGVRTHIDYIRVRGFTDEEAAAEQNIIDSLGNFPRSTWRGFDSFFPFGVYVGYLRSDFESWGGDYEGAYGNYARNHFNYVPSNDEVELGRFRGQLTDEGLESFIAEQNRLIAAAKATGMKLSADVRRIMEGRDPLEGYRQVLPVARRLAAAFPGDDVIVSWKMADEPGIGRMLQLATGMRAFAEADPLGRPQLIEFNNTASFAAFTPYLNLNCWDLYPVLEKRRNPWAIREQVRRYRELMPDRPMWVALQSFETRPPAPDGSYVRPSDAEIRMMAYIAIAEGVKGLTWYAGWSGSGRDEGLVGRTGSHRGGMMATLKDLATRLIPIGQQLLHTDPAPGTGYEIEVEQDETERGIVASALQHRRRDVTFLVVVNEDLANVRSARVTLPQDTPVFDLFAMDGRNRATGRAFTVDDLAGGDGRIYLAGGDGEYAALSARIRSAAALEQIRALTPDVSIARRWGVDLTEVDVALEACREFAAAAAADEAQANADRAGRLLFAMIESDSHLGATRRALRDIRIELAEIERICEHFSKTPQWWTGRNHPMLIPNPTILPLSKRYFELGRAYRDLNACCIRGDRQDLWPRIHEARLTSLQLREDVLAMIRARLKPEKEPSVP